MTLQENEQSGYRVIFFDLDGTLLPMDMDEFLEKYYAALTAHVVGRGYDGPTFVTALNAGVRAMIDHDDGQLNADAFWATFFQHVEQDALPWMDVLNDFYGHDFGGIGEGVVPDTHAVQAIDTLRRKGYPLVLTTMPLFPMQALQWRLQWAGLDESPFMRLTHYENSRSTKPKLSYFAENLAACKVLGTDVLMVGNNTVEDAIIRELGSDLYIVTDHLLDPAGVGVDGMRHGTMEEFAHWVDSLPPCEHPVESVETGPISLEMRDMALLANGGFSTSAAQEAAHIADSMRPDAGDR